MKISVTAEHIKKGKRQHCSLCPIALAMIDAGIEDPYVHTNVVLTGIDYESRGYFTLSPAAKRFISRFDCGRAVEPFEFELSPKEEPVRTTTSGATTFG